MHNKPNIRQCQKQPFTGQLGGMPGKSFGILHVFNDFHHDNIIELSIELFTQGCRRQDYLSLKTLPLDLFN